MIFLLLDLHVLSASFSKLYNLVCTCSSTELQSVMPDQPTNRLISEVGATSNIAGARAGPELSNMICRLSFKMYLQSGSLFNWLVCLASHSVAQYWNKLQTSLIQF